MMSVNWWGVLVAALSSMVVGSIWYGPLFGKRYMEVMGFNSMSPEQKQAMRSSMMWSYVGQFILSVVTAYVLAIFIGKLGMWSWTGGATVAFWIWLGFVLTMRFGDTLWGGKKALFWMSAGSSVITLLVMGAILGAWH